MKAAWVSCDDCGWSSRRALRSQAQAEHAYRQHSCEKKRRDDAARARGEARDAAIDRTPKPCNHKQVDHQHGTYACYVLDGCRCLQCAFASSEYDRALAKRKAYGRHQLVDAAPVREHVAALNAAGVGLKTIAKRSGVAHGALWKLVYGKKRPDGSRTPSVRVRKDTADRLLALDPADPALHADGAKVDGTGTTRRLQALAALGWSTERLAVAAGLDPQPLRRALTGEQYVLARTARAVGEVYRSLWATQPGTDTRFQAAGVARVRNHAAAQGWAPPLAWDDDTIDDPKALPMHQLQDEHGTGIDEAAVDRALGGERVHLTRAERWVVVQRLHAQGLSDGEIARRAHLIDRTVLRDRQQLGLPANVTQVGDHSGRVA